MKSRYAISRRDLNRSLVDRCQRSGQGRGSTYRGFQEHRTLADWSHDPRYPDGCSEPFIPRICGNDRSLRERARWEVVHRAIAHREIANPGDEETMLNEIAKRDYPISQGIAGPTEGSMGDRWHRISGYREFRGQGVHAL
jgi:hypothetical protein